MQASDVLGVEVQAAGAVPDQVFHKDRFSLRGGPPVDAALLQVSQQYLDGGTRANQFRIADVVLTYQGLDLGSTFYEIVEVGSDEVAPLVDQGRMSFGNSPLDRFAPFSAGALNLLLKLQDQLATRRSRGLRFQGPRAMSACAVSTASTSVGFVSTIGMSRLKISWVSTSEGDESLRNTLMNRSLALLADGGAEYRTEM